MEEYLEAEDLRGEQSQRVAVDLDETLALLVSLVYAIRVESQCDYLFDRTLQWATAVAESVSRSHNKWIRQHTRLLLAEALHTRSGSHGGWEECRVVRCRCRRKKEN